MGLNKSRCSIVGEKERKREMWSLDNNGERQWPSGRVVASEPEGPGFDFSSRQPQVVAHQH